MKNIKTLFITSVLLLFVSLLNSNAELLDSWEDQGAYKPIPILFLHGFALGSPDSWDYMADFLGQYYQPYRDIVPALSGSVSYLERIDFQDSNGSVDRYDPGEFNPQGNSAGWANKVDIAVDDMLENFHLNIHINDLVFGQSSL